MPFISYTGGFSALQYTTKAVLYRTRITTFNITETHSTTSNRSAYCLHAVFNSMLWISELSERFVFVVALLCHSVVVFEWGYLQHVQKTQVCLRSVNKRKKQRAGVRAWGRDMKTRWRAKMRALLSKTAALHHKNNKRSLSRLLRS